MTGVFDRIYRDNVWNGVESRSGPGSDTAATARVAPAILALVDELGISSVLDVACGDGYWMPPLPGYLGIDVAGEAIARSRRRHPDRDYLVGNVAAIAPRPFDLVIFRDAMQHLPLGDGLAALEAIRASGSRWLLASTYVGGENVDVGVGDCYSPDLAVAPFSLGPPERLIFDGYRYDDPDAARDPRKHLGLWPLTSDSRGLTIRP